MRSVHEGGLLVSGAVLAVVVIWALIGAASGWGLRALWEEWKGGKPC